MRLRAALSFLYSFKFQCLNFIIITQNDLLTFYVKYVIIFVSQVHLFSKIGGKTMKKITVNEALSQLKHGFFPKCEISRDLLKPVKSEQELQNFFKLSTVQKCQFYGYEQNEIKNFKVPDGGLELSVNEATDMLFEGEKVYARVIGENEQNFTDLNSFVTFLRKCNINGDTFLLYLRD